MRSHAISIQTFVPPIPQRKREVRDPYDGLRLWSAITHGVGAVLALAGTIFLLVQSALLEKWLQFALFTVYGLSMVCLYTASTLYHTLKVSVPGRIALRKYDHCSIYLLIAGSYTPICLTILRHNGGPLLLWWVWGLAAAGLVLTVAKLSIPRWLSSAIYLGMGWLAVFNIGPIFRLMPAEGFFWLLLGGILYTIGGVLYAVKWPGRANPRFGCHEIFHLFILLGSVAHFVLMQQVILQL